MDSRTLLKVDRHSHAAGPDNYKRADKPRENDRPTDRQQNSAASSDPTFQRVNVDDNEVRRRANQRTRIIATMVADGTLGTPNIIAG